MEIEAKISPPKHRKRFWVIEWDKSKYRLHKRKVTVALAISFAFFAGYALLSATTKLEGQRKTEMVTPTLYPITEIEAISQVSPSTQSEISQKPRVSRTLFFGPQVIYREQDTLPAGIIVKAKLLSGASDGPVRARVVADALLNGERVLEAGSILVGHGTSSEDRLFIRFDKLARKDGTSVPIQANALDETDRIPGLKGNKINSELTKLAAGIALNFVGGLSEGLQDTDAKNGVAIKPPSFKNAFLNGAAKAALEQSKELVSSYREKAPRIEVETGRFVYVLFESLGGK